MTVEEIIEQLKLTPHPEGGFYREIYRSGGFIDTASLPGNFTGKRRFSTSIYYLLREGDISAFHRIRSDELWHYYSGGNIILHLLDHQFGHQTKILGNEIKSSSLFQVVVPANIWFAAESSPGSSYTLVGCTVSPGFDFSDFELANKDQLLKQFPDHAELVNRLCKPIELK